MEKTEQKLFRKKNSSGILEMTKANQKQTFLYSKIKVFEQGKIEF